ncbi:MAG: hypothetical protein KVP17_004451 [Porospora cf. gigantea B]|uniref:uncharacterized protein n=2 Tax=Porospora cf. gigantea B TaxID=2853592 RepID=UPI0035719E10|nr:MAG: hypothetical protein KVP17_004451 [Porospora cf. gigantea B]
MKVDGLLLLLHRLELSLILAPVILDKAAVQLGASAWAAPICAYLVSTRLAIFLVSWVYGVLVPLLIVYITGFTHFRWQSIPAMLSLSVTASNVYADPELYGNVLRGFSLYAFAIPRAGIFLLSQLLSWLVQVPQLATPDGPYGVGVDSETFEDGGLQVSVNIFYPVSKLAPTDLTFQYVNESSVRVIGERLKIPSVLLMFLLDSTSNASPYAPISTAKQHWPLVLHSHDILSTASCNVSYCEKLCADGAIVVLINHATHDQEILRTFSDKKTTRRRFLLSRLRQLDFVLAELRSRSESAGRMVERHVDWTTVMGSGVGIGASAVLGHCIRQLATHPNAPPIFHVLSLVSPCLDGFLMSELSPRISNSMKSYFTLTSDNESATEGERLPSVTLIHIPQQVMVITAGKSRPGAVGRCLKRRWRPPIAGTDDRRRARNATMLVRLLYMRPKASLNVFLHINRANTADLSDLALVSPFLFRSLGLTGAREANHTNMLVAQAVSNLLHHEYRRNLIHPAAQKTAILSPATETLKPLLAPVGSIRLPARRELSSSATAVLLALEMLDVKPYRPGHSSEQWRAHAIELLVTANGQDEPTKSPHAKHYITEGLLSYIDLVDARGMSTDHGAEYHLPGCIDINKVWTLAEI